MTVTATKLSLESHLHLNGNAKAAFDSYQKTFGGTLCRSAFSSTATE